MAPEGMVDLKVALAALFLLPPLVGGFIGMVAALILYLGKYDDD